MIRAAATLGDEQTDFYSDDRSITYFQSLLPHSDKIVSVYVGLTDGSFRQARRVDPNNRIGNAFPPPGIASSPLAGSIRARRGRCSIATPFLDKGGKELGNSTSPRPTIRARAGGIARRSRRRANCTSPIPTSSRPWAWSASRWRSPFTSTARWRASSPSTSRSTASGSISPNARSVPGRSATCSIVAATCWRRRICRAATPATRAWSSCATSAQLDNELPAIAYGARPHGGTMRSVLLLHPGWP